MEKANKTYKITTHALIYCVYAIFFSVQFFFNFEGFSGSPQFSGYCSFLHASHEDSVLVKGQSLPPSGGHKIRLNKRFHQENISPSEVINVVTPERYLPLQTPDYYIDIHLPATVRVNHPLRGPPVVA